MHKALSETAKNHCVLCLLYFINSLTQSANQSLHKLFFVWNSFRRATHIHLLYQTPLLYRFKCHVFTSQLSAARVIAALNGTYSYGRYIYPVVFSMQNYPTTLLLLLAAVCFQ